MTCLLGVAPVVLGMLARANPIVVAHDTLATAPLRLPQSAVIRVQAPTALIVLGANIGLALFFRF